MQNESGLNKVANMNQDVAKHCRKLVKNDSGLGADEFAANISQGSCDDRRSRRHLKMEQRLHSVETPSDGPFCKSKKLFTLEDQSQLFKKFSLCQQNLLKPIGTSKSLHLKNKLLTREAAISGIRPNVSQPYSDMKSKNDNSVVP